MEGKLQTSFIPKKPIAENGASYTTGISLVTLFAVVIFLISLALAGTVFIYQAYLTKSIAGMKDSFTRSEQAFNPNSVTTYSLLNNRISVATSLIKNHEAVSTLFDLLEQATLKSVRFTNFTFAYISPQHSTLSMKGQTLGSNYNSVAKQSDVFSQDPFSKYIHNPIFSNLNLDQNGNVVFDFSGDVDSQQILYRNNLPQH
jgi:hypothetical protein